MRRQGKKVSIAQAEVPALESYVERSRQQCYYDMAIGTQRLATLLPQNGGIKLLAGYGSPISVTNVEFPDKFRQAVQCIHKLRMSVV